MPPSDHSPSPSISSETNMAAMSGFWDLFAKLTIDAFVHPKRVFSQVPIGKGFGFAFAFAFISITLATLFLSLEELLLFKTEPATLSASLALWGHVAPILPENSNFFNNEVIAYSSFNLIGGWCLLIFDYISAISFHLMLHARKGTEKKFIVTFQIFSFSKALEWICLIPWIGLWLALGWNLVWTVVGLKISHETTYTRVVTTLILTNLILGMVVFGTVFFIGFFWES